MACCGSSRAGSQFLAPLDVRKIPGVGKVTEKNLHALGIRKVGDLARLDEAFLEQRFGKWGLALAGKSRGVDAGGWFDSRDRARNGPKSISHEHTFDEIRRRRPARVHAGAAFRDGGTAAAREPLHARTLQLKLRYSDFTPSRAPTRSIATQLDKEIFEEIRRLFHTNWREGAEVRLLGVQASRSGRIRRNWISWKVRGVKSGRTSCRPPISCAINSGRAP